VVVVLAVLLRVALRRRVALREAARVVVAEWVE
jgi:hypothetical protein